MGKLSNYLIASLAVFIIAVQGENNLPNWGSNLNPAPPNTTYPRNNSDVESSLGISQPKMSKAAVCELGRQMRRDQKLARIRQRDLEKEEQAKLKKQKRSNGTLAQSRQNDLEYKEMVEKKRQKKSDQNSEIARKNKIKKEDKKAMLKFAIQKQKADQSILQASGAQNIQRTYSVPDPDPIPDPTPDPLPDLSDLSDNWYSDFYSSSSAPALQSSDLHTEGDYRNQMNLNPGAPVPPLASSPPQGSGGLPGDQEEYIPPEDWN